MTCKDCFFYSSSSCRLGLDSHFEDFVELNCIEDYCFDFVLPEDFDTDLF